jgi:serine phosphatase RsbU (regulator of sigma subunit)/anti-sigma regulatory factor (Ser/Thr protein kinase)
VLEFEFLPNDPLLPYLLNVSNVVEVDQLEMDSPALEDLKAKGIRITIPLVSQGELIGLLNLGPRLSEQEYSTDDRRLLSNLATQAAPALRVAQLARQQQAEARERERFEQELRVARSIQQTLLPKEVPEPTGWKINALWQPARAVGGDFYDFIDLGDDRLGIIVADVTDKGVPAALVMATTRSIVRAAAERLVKPGTVLERANELLCPDIPQNMFVTCLYLILNTRTGHLVFANAGHNLPYVCTRTGITELRATGMPLGLMVGMKYEENEVELKPGDTLVLSSDGLAESHNPDREMFGLPRLRGALAAFAGRDDLIDHLMAQHAIFTGEAEQEDDITLVSLVRENLAEVPAAGAGPGHTAVGPSADWKLVDRFEIPSAPGNERQARSRVAAAIASQGLPEDKVRKLETAVAEATMNAMEHGNKYQEDLLVTIDVCTRPGEVMVRVKDRGGKTELPDVEVPDLDAKLAGEQSPRGWGLYLIRNMVDELRIDQEDGLRVVELVVRADSEPGTGQGVDDGRS